MNSNHAAGAPSADPTSRRQLDQDAITANPAVDQDQLRAFQDAMARLKSLGIDTDRTEYKLRRPFEGSAHLESNPTSLRKYAFRSSGK